MIGLAGLKNSGKNTVANFIEEWGKQNNLIVVQKGFADNIKWAAASIFWPKITLQDAIGWADEFKNSKESRVIISDWDDKRSTEKTYKQITGREFLQHVGTDMGRDIFGSSFWVEQLLGVNWESDWDKPDIAVITDVRFPNEAKRIRMLDGEIWNINRGLSSSDLHISEKPLEDKLINVTINNLNSIDYLQKIVFAELNRMTIGQINATSR